MGAHAEILAELIARMRRLLPGEANLPWGPIFEHILGLPSDTEPFPCSKARFCSWWVSPDAAPTNGRRLPSRRDAVDAAVVVFLRRPATPYDLVARLCHLRALCAIWRTASLADVATQLGLTLAQLRGALEFSGGGVPRALRYIALLDPVLALHPLRAARRQFLSARDDCGAAAMSEPGKQALRMLRLARMLHQRQGPIELLPSRPPDRWRNVPLALAGTGYTVALGRGPPDRLDTDWIAVSKRLDSTVRLPALYTASRNTVAGRDAMLPGCLYAVLLRVEPWRTSSGELHGARTLLYIGQSTRCALERLREHLLQPRTGSMLDTLLRCRLRGTGRLLVSDFCCVQLRTGVGRAADLLSLERAAIAAHAAVGPRGANLRG